MADTHMRQRPSDHVTLEAVGLGVNREREDDPTQIGFDFSRIRADGSRDPSPPYFRVPIHKVLVVTDVDWQYAGGTPGGAQTFRIFIFNLASGVMNRVFESTVILNGSGEGGISEAMTSGFVVSSGGRIAVDTFPGGGRIQHVVIRGYLCKES